ncbi:ribosome maturation factor RimM [soil metagenome]
MAAPFPVGRIVGAFGLRGELKVEPLTDFLERLHKGSKLILKGETITVEAFRMHKGRPLMRLTGINTIDEAEKLQWQVLESTSDAKPELEEDEFFTDDLIGMKVVTVEGQELGEVDDVLETAAHEILQVGEILIPAIKEFVKDVDFDTETITVQLIPGMIEDSE